MSMNVSTASSVFSGILPDMDNLARKDVRRLLRTFLSPVFICIPVEPPLEGVIISKSATPEATGFPPAPQALELCVPVVLPIPPYFSPLRPP